MPRAKVPRTAIEFVELVDKRGVADLQRVFQCSRREAEDVALRARRAVAQGYRYEVLEPPKGNLVAVARPPMPGRAISDKEIRELAKQIDPPELRGLTAEQYRERQRAEQDRLRRERNAANGYHEEDPEWLRRWHAWVTTWNNMTEEERKSMGATPQEQERAWPA